MAGLLDIFGGGDTPESQAQTAMYLGLLGATTPKGQRTRLGPAFAQAGQQYMSTLGLAKQQALKDRLINAQLSEHADALQLKKDSAANAQAQQQLKNDFLGIGRPNAALNIGPVEQGMNTPYQVAPSESSGQTAQSLADQYGIPVDAIKSDFLMNGGKGISDMIYKRGTPDMQVSNGYAYNKNSLGAGFMPSLKQSDSGQTSMVRIGADGMPQVDAPRGAMDTYGAYKRIDEGTKAGYDMAAPYTRPDGTTIMQTRAQQVREATGGLAPAERGGYANEGQMKQSMSGGMGADPAAIQREIRSTQQSLMSPLDPQSKSMLQAHLGDLLRQSKNTPMPNGGGISVQSEPDKIKLAKTAEADVIRDTARQKDIKTANQFLSIAKSVGDILDKNPTNSGIGSAYDSMAAFFGASPKGANEANQLKALGGWLVSNVPRMEGPQSNFDVAGYQVMAADVANDRLPVERRKAALGAIQKMMLDQLKTNNSAPQIGATGSFEVPSQNNTIPQGFKVIR